MAVSLYEQFLDNEDSTRIFDIISKWRAKNEAEDKDYYYADEDPDEAPKKKQIAKA